MPLTEPAGVHRPHHTERTVVYRLYEEHFERYVREYEERYEAREGSLRKVVPTAVEVDLACGRLEGGFARIRCPDCRAEHLLAFSCRTRSFCPSCQAKRSARFAGHVITAILEPVPHRHVVLTIPRVLRGPFQRERRSLGLLARSARDAIVPSLRANLDGRDVSPGLVVSIQTFGSYAANVHPHVRALVTDGAFTEEGEFLHLPYFDARLVEEVFRLRVLERRVPRDLVLDVAGQAAGVGISSDSRPPPHQPIRGLSSSGSSRRARPPPPAAPSTSAPTAA